MAGAGRLLTMDLHAGQIQGFFNIPVDELTAKSLLANYLSQQGIGDLTVVATDAGFAKKARNLAELLDAPLAIVEKRRLGNDGHTEGMSLIGTVAGRHGLIVDDEVDTAGSLTQAVQVVREHGAGDVYAAASHGVLSGPAIERLSGSGLKELILTDNVPIPAEKRLPFLTTLSIAPLLAGAIEWIHDKRSVSVLFDGQRENSDK